jgi:hypothetical protein
MNSTTSDPSSAVAALAATFGLIGFTIVAASIVLGIVINWRIASKAGYQGALSLLMLIPLVNFVVLIIFAFSKWPIEEALEHAYTPQPAYTPPPPPPPAPGTSIL